MVPTPDTDVCSTCLLLTNKRTVQAEKRSEEAVSFLLDDILVIFVVIRL